MARYFLKSGGEAISSPGHLPSGSPAWYAVHTRSRHEAKVARQLHAMALEVFLPRLTVLSRRRDRRKFLEVPLFPGYLFIYTDLQPWIYQEIIRLFGVVRILGTKDSFSPVPGETVESIRTVVASGRPYWPRSFLRNGSKVRIIDGPLAGVTGTVVARRAKKRKLVVSVELFRRAVAVELGEEAFEPV